MLKKKMKPVSNSASENLEQRLRYSEAEFDALFDAAVDAVIEINDRGHIQRFNQAAERIFGYSEAEAFDQNVHILMPEPYHSEHDDYLKRYQKTGEAKIIGIGREVRARHKDGHIFPIELSVGEVKISGNPVYLGIIKDISARKKSESDAQETRDRLASMARVGVLGEMATGLAHEINQPLTAIASYARASRRLVENMDAGSDDAENLEDTLEKIAVQAERAGEIIRRLRGLIKQGEGEHELADVVLLIKDILKLAEVDIRESGVEIELEETAGIPKVMVDPIQIQQVLLNLIRNAMEAMSEIDRGKKITISVRKRRVFVEIVVADVGPGIPDNEFGKLFEPFFTTKQAGLGMGLALCRTIMKTHGGGLTCLNNRMGGASFTMHIPVTDKSS